MDKLRTEISSDFKLDKVINAVKKDPLFKDVEVTLLNLNSCLVMQEEYSNCKNCPGLANCPNSNKGYYTIFKDNDFVLTKCKKKKEYDTINSQNKLIKTLYMPKNIREASLDKFQINTEERTEVYKKVCNFLTNYETSHQKGLYLYGTYGCGKTYILGALANALAKRNITSLLIYFPDLIRELKDSLKDDRFSNIINELKEIDVLMLDDLGSENLTSFVRDEVLGPVLNFRMGEGKSIFISSNLTPTQLREHLKIVDSSEDLTKAMRIVSRIFETSEAINMGRRKFDGNSKI